MSFGFSWFVALVVVTLVGHLQRVPHLTSSHLITEQFVVRFVSMCQCLGFSNENVEAARHGGASKFECFVFERFHSALCNVLACQVFWLTLSLFLAASGEIDSSDTCVASVTLLDGQALVLSACRQGRVAIVKPSKAMKS